ncbi:thiamine-phosphate pyrophosphorylase [Stackebrandtia endophytica]|uniref:Thiamine-phosphate pyrophosphorylase n=1 Tax=Stackebrandtia endophytica TaxID=1496996 RepID=A0A543ARW7_9ACTN|nr:thiamine phosphate synthase [Stackebrandtia endophytica]TQL75286.1 thiamine-phosphate pyrophosphorylase [Stackebrandtia endophytica]
MAVPAHRLLVLTDASQTRGGTPADLVEQVCRARVGGPFSLILREKALPAYRRRDLATELSRRLPDVEVIVADPGWPVTACHLSAHARLPTARPRLVGRSIHRGEHPGSVDYVTYSPIYATASKPGYGPVEGETGLRDACHRLRIPVYALAGVESAERVVATRRAGAHGVAVMGAIMRADDPAEIVRRITDALSSPIRPTG